jgi:hypothetical protein
MQHEEDIKSFYDTFAQGYHSMFPDWESAITRSSGLIDILIKKYYGKDEAKLLDCSCGIGTQCL